MKTYKHDKSIYYVAVKVGNAIIYKLYVNHKLHSQHFTKDSVFQVVYSLAGRKSFVRDEDFEEIE